MKIAFLEYEMKLHSGGDANFLVCWVKLLKEYGHTVDVLQYKSSLKSSYCYDKTIEIKNIIGVDFSTYDIVIINNLYLSRPRTPREFIEFVYQLPTKTLCVNHERSTLRFFFRGNHMYDLMNMCDGVICYYDNLINQIVLEDKIQKLTFWHFYKPNEDTTPEKMFARHFNLTYLARLNRVKGFYKFVDFSNHYHNKLPNETITMYGYVGSIGHVPFRQMDEMILEISNESKKNTEDSFIHFRKQVSDRQEVVDILKTSEFSWNAYSFEKLGKKLYHVIDNGLEAGSIEAMMYGCVPILNEIHKDLDIPLGGGKSIKFGDCNCAIFINDSMSNSEIFEMIQEERRTNYKRNNLKQVNNLFSCKDMYHAAIINSLQNVINKPSNRKFIDKDYIIKDIYNVDNLLTKGRIR